MIENDVVPLDFDREKEKESESWERARNENAELLEETGDQPGEYRLAFEDGDEHILRLVEYQDQELGVCDCKGFQHHDGPCAHLVYVRRQAAVDTSLMPTVDEDPQAKDLADEVDVVETYPNGDDAGDDLDLDRDENVQEDVVDVDPVEDDDQEGHGDRADQADPPAPQADRTTVDRRDDQDVEDLATMELDDPLEVLPTWMKTEVDRRDGSLDLNKRGCQVVATALDLEVHPDPIQRAQATEFEYAVYRATVERPDGRVFEAEAEAHVDENNVEKWDLNRMAETRAKKRAVKWATGGGLLAMADDRDDDVLEGHDPDHADVATDGGNRR